MAKNKGTDQPSVPLFFAYAKDRFSYDMAQLMAYFAYFYNKTYVKGVNANQMSTHNIGFLWRIDKTCLLIIIKYSCGSYFSINLIKWTQSEENPSSVFLTRFNTNQPVHPQKMAGGWKFQI